MKKRYDFLNNTLEGLELVQNAEDPSGVSSGVLPGPAVVVGADVSSVTAADVGEDHGVTPPAENGGVPMTDPALAPDEHSPFGYVRDRLGRRLKKDEFGYILRPTTRPRGISKEDGRIAGSAGRKKILAGIRASETAADPDVTERPATGPPSGSAYEEAPPAVAAEEVAWNNHSSMGEVELSMMEFDSWGEFDLDSMRPTCTHQKGGLHTMFACPQCVS